MPERDGREFEFGSAAVGAILAIGVCCSVYVLIAEFTDTQTLAALDGAPAASIFSLRDWLSLLSGWAAAISAAIAAGVAYFTLRYTGLELRLQHLRHQDVLERQDRRRRSTILRARKGIIRPLEEADYLIRAAEWPALAGFGALGGLGGAPRLPVGSTPEETFARAGRLITSVVDSQLFKAVANEIETDIEINAIELRRWLGGEVPDDEMAIVLLGTTTNPNSPFNNDDQKRIRRIRLHVQEIKDCVENAVAEFEERDQGFE